MHSIILHCLSDKQLAILAGQSEYVYDPKGATTIQGGFQHEA